MRANGRGVATMKLADVMQKAKEEAMQKVQRVNVKRFSAAMLILFSAAVATPRPPRDYLPAARADHRQKRCPRHRRRADRQR